MKDNLQNIADLIGALAEDIEEIVEFDPNAISTALAG